MKYLKIVACEVSAKWMHGLAIEAERICFKDIIVGEFAGEPVKSRARYLTIKSSSNLHNLDCLEFPMCE